MTLNVVNATVHGDVNGDGTVNAADVTALYDIMLGNDNTYASTADVNNDNSITAADITEVYDIILGNYTAPPVVYVHSELGWSDYCLYVWKDGHDLSASWPGEHYTSTTILDSELWYAWELPEVYYTSTGTNWIINNNNNGKQYDLMQNFSYNKDVYIRVSNDGS